MRRWRYPRKPRGRVYSVPSQQVSPVGRSQLRRRIPRLRRGSYRWVPPASQAPQAPPAFPPTAGRERLRQAIRGRRGRLFQVPLQGQAPVVVVIPPRMVQQPRKRFRPRRRGRFLWTPPVVVVVQFPPQRMARRRRLATRFARFARFFRPPFGVIVPVGERRDITILEMARPATEWGSGAPYTAFLGADLTEGSTSVTEPFTGVYADTPEVEILVADSPYVDWVISTPDSSHETGESPHG